MTYHRLIIFIFFLLTSTGALALTIDDIIQHDNPPSGVVIEIVSNNENTLNNLYPKLISDIDRLKARFPDMPIAIVTHGREQFSLMSNKSEKYAEMHSGIKSIVEIKGVDLHVCGTYAERKGVEPEEFPHYVNVSAEGPAQINDYVKLGYLLITLP